MVRRVYPASGCAIASASMAGLSRRCHDRPHSFLRRLRNAAALLRLKNAEAPRLKNAEALLPKTAEALLLKMSKRSGG